MNYRMLKKGDIKQTGYEFRVHACAFMNKNYGWKKGWSTGQRITERDIISYEYRVPIKPKVKIERTPHRTYTVTAISEAQQRTREIKELSDRISEITKRIDEILSR